MLKRFLIGVLGLIAVTVLFLVAARYHYHYDHDVQVDCYDASCTASVEMPPDFSLASQVSMPELAWHRATVIDVWDGLTHWVWREHVVDISLKYRSAWRDRAGLYVPLVYRWRCSKLDDKVPPAFIDRVVLTKNGRDVLGDPPLWIPQGKPILLPLSTAVLVFRNRLFLLREACQQGEMT